MCILGDHEVLDSQTWPERLSAFIAKKEREEKKKKENKKKNETTTTTTTKENKNEVEKDDDVERRDEEYPDLEVKDIVVIHADVRLLKCVVDGIVAFLLRVRPLRLFGMVQRHRYTLRRRTMSIVQFLATLWFLTLVSTRLTIEDEIWAALVAIAEADVGIGELVISVGGVLLFALTIWVAYQISRFIRFFLEEDVYTRVPLKKGSRTRSPRSRTTRC